HPLEAAPHDARPEAQLVAEVRDAQGVVAPHLEQRAALDRHAGKAHVEDARVEREQQGAADPFDVVAAMAALLAGHLAVATERACGRMARRGLSGARARWGWRALATPAGVALAAAAAR